MRSTIRLFAPLLLLPTLAAPVLAATAAPVSPNCGGSTTPIADIQGPGAPSPLAGQNASIEAVVTADFGGTYGFGGFFVQQADPQRRNQPGVSEGLFVYAPKVRAKAGDLVHVTGKVEEKYGQTQLTLSGAIAVCANGQTVTPATLTLPVDSPNAFAAYEGMLVRLPQTLTVTDNYELGRYGSTMLSNGRLRTPTSVVSPSQAQTQIDANARNRLILDDGSNKQNPASVPYPAPALSAANTLRSGYTVRNVEGVLEVRYGAWRVQALPGAAAPTFDTRANPRTNAPARDPKSNLRVASFNVLNYFNGNGMGGGFDDPNNRGAKNYQEFQRQEAKIVSALKALDADVIGLMEIQNNGYGELSAVRQLAAKLGSNWRVVDPGTSRLGGDAITVAMIYDSRTVEPVGRASTLAIDDKNRQPLAQSFRRVGGNKQALTIAVNHLKSKNCPDAANDDLDQGDGQGCWNPTRTRAAAKLADWLAGTPTGVAGQGTLLIGDFNSYTYEDPIRLLEARGYRNLVSRWIGANAYSYVYNGEAGYLDHALASLPLASHVKAVHEWHINADEPLALQYTLAYKSTEQQKTYYAPDAYRSSDHDPVLIDIALPGGGR
ncbi:endonuclease/Exonuclease/phosphatase family protein [Burkholderia ambifaria AMMD]|uniref:Endonuclease/exonuclease/phosphatase n=1 Tax=Burkholderia ambifaria (strain ATCC BAA-244 / DSM 16087 / CCUG 44356 / LMG 19182 / AMMD) TaxID=339670 RepID=Q0B530_BURCM|nr:ExeM/NucH family extracellular endonuclease [Burkholderia ambifaria]ABI90743.1 Endonuclease/exonuclease/phosphatase [Burkholderia ambifaria AMMD]AJY24476.1 endonuclease/Exonuclease/phosphatase family protein [Burkholderia ambifaria AMMD]MBR7934039.1 ExeM/NucH family extracellular endonuclease [Burkholderia ambifaria]PEH68757.1 endonuclease [Burkholderia ambifaria]QQC06655.1 ExeM/NucH family extracellular endonuclease [Burkholderia ambifaria]